MTSENKKHTYNKGEWSELYTFLKLLRQGRVDVADNHAKKLDGVYYPIIKIIREEIAGHPTEYIIQNDNINILKDNEQIMSFNRNELDGVTAELLAKIKEGRKTFPVESVEDYANGIRVTKFKQSSSDKADILMQIKDIHTGIVVISGFSIKSYIGNPPTLINASKATRFRYQINNFDAGKVDEINKISARPCIKSRLKQIRKIGGTIIFDKPVNETYERNLRLEDTSMPEIIAELLLIFYERGIHDCKKAINALGKSDPLEYGETIMYEAKFKRFLADSALGMKPATKWEAENEAKGGYIIVKDNGEILAYTLYDMDAFKQYLYESTKFEEADKSRNDFGYIYAQNGKYYIDLNLQIRFQALPK